MRYLYLHGFASSPASKKAGYFRGRFQECRVELEVPDLADGDFENLTITSQLHVVRRAAGADPVCLLGSSLGGYLAALYAARHSEVQRIVLIAPAFDFAARWRERLGDAVMKGWKESGWLPIYHYGAEAQRRVGYGLYGDSLDYEPFPDVRQPVLVLHGRLDDVVPVELSGEFAAGRSQAEFRTYEDGHELAAVMAEMWNEIRRFLRLQR
ncbi:MAG: YqiA/YcfP family alpha/beta fold hydrolase [Bryobacteraceae bacterium]